MRITILVACLVVLGGRVFADAGEVAKWDSEAKRVTITRDDWGIAHVIGTRDADAVFGAMYAQAEDDFNRIEVNYLNSTGRLAEAEGEQAIWSDLRMKLFVDPVEMKAKYESSPEWLKKLMNAWADGLNYYLYTHPNVKPRVITRFEPWMPLTFSEGSIGGDIETISLAGLRDFYSNEKSVSTVYDPVEMLREPSGSNGMAIAPKNTKDNHALLLINPHTSFYFRSELQMTSGEGLNAYGAATWGQFFIYQGFNQYCGWMHTSSAVDAIDEYIEDVKTRDGKYFYRYGKEERPITVKQISVPYKTATGEGIRKFDVYYTIHGPVVRKADGKWVTVSLMQEPVKALMQSYGRTKAKGLAEFRKLMDLQANSSNNTLFADYQGNIAYFHPSFIPRRDDKFDWTKPVDGSDPATVWKGLLSVDEVPQLLNPKSGWVYNSNDWPWAAAGPGSLDAAKYPKYVDKGVESARGRHAVMVLAGSHDLTLETLRAAAYDSYLPWFERTLPALLRAWDDLPSKAPLRGKLADQIALLRSWNKRWSVESPETSLAVFWAEDLTRKLRLDPRRGTVVEDYIADKAKAEELLTSLAAASDRLQEKFGSWRTPWGEINRFQRLTDDIQHPFSDSAPSIPVGFTSAIWGSLASFGAAPYKGSSKIYGTSGNSFVAVVEFGPKVRARAITAGGESGDPASKHFNDQAVRYSKGDLREVYFYPAQLKGHTEKVYRPGTK